MSRRPRFVRYARLVVPALVLVLGATASASAQGFVENATPQAVAGAPQYLAAPQAPIPAPLYQGRPFTPHPIPAPRPVLTPAAASPQASAQAPAACACYYPQGFCPMPQGFCPMPQGNCVAPQGDCAGGVPCGVQPSGQILPAAQYAAPQG